MSTELKVFLIRPQEIVVYSINPDGKGNKIYNAGSMEILNNQKVEGYTEVSGSVTSKFKVNPLIVAYENGTFEIVYVPPVPGGYVFKSDGTLAQHNKVPVTATSKIFIPCLEKSTNLNTLTSLELADPQDSAVIDYAKMSQKGIEYSSNKTYDQLMNEMSLASPQYGARSPSPRVIHKTIPESGNSNELVQRLQREVEELKTVVRAMNQRLYRIYPVIMPEKLRTGDKLGSIISVDEIQTKMAKKEIDNMEINPLFQSFAGSHRGDNRMLTFYGKDGQIYHVRANYDAVANKINPPT